MTTKKIDIVTWLKNWFEQTSNKVTSWSATVTNTKYPSEKLVKDSLDNKVDKINGKGLSTEDYTSAEKTKLSGIETGATKTTIDSSLSNSSTNPVQNKVVNSALGGKANTSHTHTVSNISDFPTLATVATTGNYNDLSNKPDLSQAGAVSLTKETTANTGYFATYTFEQNGLTLGQIDIPKDFLVKSGSVKTVSIANNPVSGYVIGDKYIDLVINTKDSTGTDEHLYIKVSDLVEDTQYSADESTITAYTSNGANKFKVKDSGITATQLNSTLKADLIDIDSISLGPTTGTDAGCIIFESLS